MHASQRLAACALAFVLAGGWCSGMARAENGFSPAEQSELVRIIEDGMANQRQPGLIVGIWIPDRGTLVRTFGVGDIATNAPIKLDDHVRIASITKTFTGVATLQLVDEGRLALDDTLSTYIEGIDNGDRITIRNLLGMTSGIFDITSDETFLKEFTADPLMAFSSQDVLDIIKRHPPAFAPGEKVVYCDTNYLLLGMIIEKVTGERARDVFTKKIIEPLGLAQTSLPTTPAMPEPYAHGYFAGDDGKGEFEDYTESNPAIPWTGGGMISTVGDLRIWAKVLANGSLLKPATHKEQMQFGMMVAEPIHVSYGLGIADFGGLIGHNGAIFGYSTAMFYWPEADATIVVAGNQATNFSDATTAIAVHLAEYLFPGKIK